LGYFSKESVFIRVHLCPVIKGNPMKDDPACYNADGPLVYAIKVQGVLDQKWSDWFDGLAITPQEDEKTLLTGPVADQAALFGLLNKIRDIGLPLLAVNRVEVSESET
jgi:hypothetical protein